MNNELQVKIWLTQFKVKFILSILSELDLNIESIEKNSISGIPSYIL